MYVLMSYKSGLLTECLITYFTGLGVISNMYAYMLYQTTLVTVRLTTHITNIRALNHYVCVYVLPDNP